MRKEEALRRIEVERHVRHEERAHTVRPVSLDGADERPASIAAKRALLLGSGQSRSARIAMKAILHRSRSPIAVSMHHDTASNTACGKVRLIATTNTTEYSLTRRDSDLVGHANIGRPLAIQQAGLLAAAAATGLLQINMQSRSRYILSTVQYSSISRTGTVVTL